MLKRELYISSLNDFKNRIDHYAHQTSFNILSLLDAWDIQNKKPLYRSYARSLLNISKQTSLEEWLGDLSLHASDQEAARKMQKALSEFVDPRKNPVLPDAITYSETATRNFEENWWNDIRVLAHGQFVNKDNADIALDSTTLSFIHKKQRDLESLGDYLIMRHRESIFEAGMEGIAVCGELPFKWQTDFEFPMFGGGRGIRRMKLMKETFLL